MTHPMLEVRDLEYQGRIAAAMLEAVFEASHDPITKVVAVRSGEIAGRSSDADRLLCGRFRRVFIADQEKAVL
jgi:hypothetical protein